MVRFWTDLSRGHTERVASTRRVRDALCHQYILMGGPPQEHDFVDAHAKVPVLEDAKKNRDADAFSVWPGHYRGIDSPSD